MYKSETRKQSTEMAGLSNDLEKIQLVEEREEIYKEGYGQSHAPAVEKGEKDVRTQSIEKGKGKFFEKVNRLLF